MVICIQHVPFETPGYIAQWAKGRGLELRIAHIYGDEKLPPINDNDTLVIMGGPMSVHDEKRYPWLIDEKRYIEKAIQSGNRVMGICLGAQLIAHVLGAKVYRNREKEIGWFNVATVENDNGIGKNLPETYMAFHWHGETFDIPSGATHIAKSDACVNQAFAIHNRIVGLQFHLEITKQGVFDLLHYCGDEMSEGLFIQTKESIENNLHYCEGAHALMGSTILPIIFMRNAQF